MTTSTWWSRAFCKGHFCYIREIRKGISKSQASSCGFLFNLQFLLQQLAGDWTHLRLCMFISLIFPVSGFAFLSLFYILCFCLLCSLRSLTVFTVLDYYVPCRSLFILCFCYTYGFIDFYVFGFFYNKDLNLQPHPNYTHLPYVSFVFHKFYFF